MIWHSIHLSYNYCCVCTGAPSLHQESYQYYSEHRCYIYSFIYWRVDYSCYVKTSGRHHTIHNRLYIHIGIGQGIYVIPHIIFRSENTSKQTHCFRCEHDFQTSIYHNPLNLDFTASAISIGNHNHVLKKCKFPKSNSVVNQM